MTPDRETKRRTVRSADPSLSPEANRRVTDELRDITRSDEVDVPRDRRIGDREARGTHSRLGATLADNRAELMIGGLILLVVGAVVALSTGSWWVLVGVVVVDAVAFGAVIAVTIDMTTNVEHPSPELAAKLQDEGVADPDGMFTDLVDDYSGDRRFEHKDATTPSSEPSKPAGPSD